MKKILLFALLFMTATSIIQAQKYFTREGKVSFYSEAPMEKIEAFNQAATSVMDTENGKMEFAILIKAFQFEKALMQEHFNENYLESSKFPKALFKGGIVDLSAVDFNKDGTYPVKVQGDLTIHGVTNPVEAAGTFTLKEGVISAASSFEVAVADYNIEIPAVVRDNIAKTVRIDIAIDYKEFKKGS